MKNSNILWLALFSLLIISCGKTTENQITIEKPQHLKMPDFSHINIQLPKVPNYVATEGTAATRGNSIKVYPSSNQLQGIINNAAPGTTLKLMEGMHYEESTIIINHEINLRGEDGATLALGGEMGLLVVDADDVSIKDLSIENIGGSVLGIGVENSEDFEFKRNEMSGFTISIILEQAYKASITESTISGIDDINGLGIVAMNGEKVDIRRNIISGSAFGAWVCDKKGRAYGNEFYGNWMGIILCKVPPGFLPFFSTGNGGADFPCIEWKVKNNNSHDNVWGYIVIDGAKDNFLSNNEGHNNSFVDLELAAETFNLFGETTPGSFTNTVHADDLYYIDCGEGNTVYSGHDAGVPCTD